MTLRTYLSEAAMTAQANVTEIGTDDRGGYIELDHTIFHAQGGGQAADRGRIGDESVSAVRNVGDDVRHYLDDASKFYVGQAVDLEVDSEWREACSRYHTGGHLIAALVEKRCPDARAIGGHHWVGEARVEFVNIESADLLTLRAEVQAEIDAIVNEERMVLIDSTMEGVRTCKIGGFPAVPCGGTHVTNTGKLRGLTISGVKVKRENVRVSYALS